MKLDINIIKKWDPYVDRYILIKNTYFRSICCHYFEYLVSKTESQFNIEIDSLKSRIISINRRKRIVSEHINLITGNKEYLLDDGTYYDDKNIEINITFDDLSYIFGKDFIKSIDISMYRDEILNKVLN
jgi:hypothetical protein